VAGAIYPDLKGRTVLVTGGGSGIGEALVKSFAAQGSRVGFIDIAAEPSAKVVDAVRAEGGTVHFEHADLRETAALQGAIEKIRSALGPITILLNNAAHDQRHKTEEVTSEYFDERIAVNLKHQFFASQAVLPDMQAAGGGSIVCFGSNSWMLGIGGMAVYTAAKSAVHGLARSLARDYGPYNIRVNVLVPGWIMTQRQLDNWLTPEADKEREEGQCLKRRLYPDDVARLALFLGSEESSGMTAQSYIVDGGWL
jgi:NAD(P)-dependent dehydrogenase (short-subunit alcohol dehydrogenase family)